MTLKNIGINRHYSAFELFDFVILKEFYDGPLDGFVSLKSRLIWIYFSKVWWSDDQDIRLYSLQLVIEEEAIESLNRYIAGKLIPAAGEAYFDDYDFASGLDIKATRRRSPDAFALGERLTSLVIYGADFRNMCL